MPSPRRHATARRSGCGSWRTRRRRYDWFYNVVSNPTLWFIQHYLWDLKSAPNLDQGLHYAWEKGYVEVNRNFADAVLDELEAEPDAIVLFHDYHLYLVPRLVREARPDAGLQHFVHIPWPQADYWHVLPLPIRQQIHHGLARERRRRLPHDALAAELPVRAAPTSSARTWTSTPGVWSTRGREIRVTANPISVDTREFDELAESPTVRAAEEALARRGGPRS